MNTLTTKLFYYYDFPYLNYVGVFDMYYSKRYTIHALKLHYVRENDYNSVIYCHCLLLFAQINRCLSVMEMQPPLLQIQKLKCQVQWHDLKSEVRNYRSNFTRCRMFLI